jgi:hypothetical protein
MATHVITVCDLCKKQNPRELWSCKIELAGPGLLRSQIGPLDVCIECLRDRGVAEAIYAEREKARAEKREPASYPDLFDRFLALPETQQLLARVAASRAEEE